MNRNPITRRQSSNDIGNRLIDFLTRSEKKPSTANTSGNEQAGVLKYRSSARGYVTKQESRHRFVFDIARANVCNWPTSGQWSGTLSVHRPPPYVSCKITLGWAFGAFDL